AVVQLQGVVADGHGLHFQMAVDLRFDHAAAGVPLGGDLAELALELVHLLANLGQVLHQAGDLADFLEHGSLFLSGVRGIDIRIARASIRPDWEMSCCQSSSGETPGQLTLAAVSTDSGGPFSFFFSSSFWEAVARASSDEVAAAVGLMAAGAVPPSRTSSASWD